MLGGGILEQAHQPLPPPHLSVPDLSLTILDGCVVDPPALTGDKEQFVMELAHRARARVTMFNHPGESLPALEYGRPVEVEGRVRGPRNFGNPHSFDYRNYLARQDVFWTVSALTVRPLGGSCGNRFGQFVSAMRQSALRRIEDLYRGDAYNTAMMDAVLIGEGSGLDRIWTEQYRSTGTFHALVISGSHVAVLAGAFLFLLRICFVPRVPATLLTVLAAWLYAVVTGWQAPVVRSAAGMSLFALGSLFFRDRRLLNILAGVALFFLVLDPDQVFDPSFQLSFLAVAFLAVFAVPIIERFSEPLAKAAQDLGDRDRDVYLAAPVSSHRVELRLYAQTISALLRLPATAGEWIVAGLARLGVFLFDLLVVSAVVQAGLALPMAIYFHRVSFTGLSANAVVVPLLGFVVPLGFLALFTGWYWLATMAAFLLDLSRRTVEFHARFEPNWRIPSPPLVLSIALGIALILSAVRWKRSIFRWLSIVATALLLVVLVIHPFRPMLRPGVLELTAIDVGQGDSLFIALPDGRVMLVDAGGIPRFGNRRTESSIPVKMDIGEDVVAPYLWTRSIRRLDVVAVSHLHDDHVGGLPAILNDFQVGELWVGAVPECDTWHKIQSIARQRRIPIRRLHGGERLRLGLASIDVFAPAVDYVPDAEPKNNDSLVFRIAYGERSALLTGDMEKPIELQVAATGTWPHSDILKIGHHGSRTSSSPEFLEQVHPALAVISDGYGNLYGHPHPETLANLGERRILAYRTDRDGLITIETDGRHIWRE